MAIVPVELGCPGHLIVASSCRWHRHTQVGLYRVSTVGDYYLPGGTVRQSLGADSDAFFETMVFRTTGTPEPNNEGCGCMAIMDYTEIECLRYPTAGTAQYGHETVVAKYLGQAQSEQSEQ